MGSVLQGLLDLIFPGFCPVCGRGHTQLLCSDCVSQLVSIQAPICQKCGKPTMFETKSCRQCWNRRFEFTTARSFAMYEGTIKTVVREFKYGNNRGLARQLAELMVGELEIDRGCDVVTWVPMGRQKQAQRGYNQAELLGRALGKRLSVEAGSLIGLKRRLREQNSLPLSGREQNVKDAFEARGDLHRLKIILADDVLTTGLTASACSGVLKRAGARAVNVITFARAPLG